MNKLAQRFGLSAALQVLLLNPIGQSKSHDKLGDMLWAYPAIIGVALFQHGIRLDALRRHHQDRAPNPTDAPQLMLCTPPASIPTRLEGKPATLLQIGSSRQFMLVCRSPQPLVIVASDPGTAKTVTFDTPRSHLAGIVLIGTC